MPPTIHIALVGGQPMPIYIGIKATNPNYVWLVHSKGEKGSEPEANIIMKQCGVPSKKVEFPAVDYPRILEKATNLLNILKGREVVINISGGTKPWAVACALLSQNMPNVSLVYVDQNNKVYDITNKKFLPLDLQMDIRTILMYNHIKTPKFTDIKDYTDKDKDALKKVQELRNFNIKDFNDLTIPQDKVRRNNLKQNIGSSYKNRESGSAISFDSKRSRVDCILIRKNGAKVIRKAESLVSPHVKDIVFFAGWFEYKVADILSNWRYQREIWLNVKFPYLNGSPKNEIDIIVNANNKLLFVECKTQIFDTTDIDKFRSAVKNYGGMSSKALFITDTPNIKPEAMQKCEDNGIMTFCMGAYKSEKQCQDDLFALLEKEMLNINKR